jgi:hypothetical protein
LFDRGRADAWYRRSFEPHWYPNGTYTGPRIDRLTAEEIDEYNRGYLYQQESGDFKEW